MRIDNRTSILWAVCMKIKISRWDRSVLVVHLKSSRNRFKQKYQTILDKCKICIKLNFTQKSANKTIQVFCMINSALSKISCGTWFETDFIYMDVPENGRCESKKWFKNSLFKKLPLRPAAECQQLPEKKIMRTEECQNFHIVIVYSLSILTLLQWKVASKIKLRKKTMCRG